MSYYYAPDKLRPVCQVCKYTFGGPFWIASYCVEEFMPNPEEKIFGEAVPIDVTQTGRSIPGYIEDMANFRKFLNNLKKMGKEFPTKTH